MKRPDYLKLAFAILGSQAAGFIGSLFTFSSVRGWYTTLERPAVNPPGWVFGPVWTTLYLLMGIAAYLVWQKGMNKKEVRYALGLFVGQLALNAMWSMVFFGLHSPGGALVNIALLWLAIIATIQAFAKVSRPAAWLLVPYLLWVSFASYLNFAIWLLNS
ncbi:MAG: Integral membrane protein [Candidatus Uhrbacteria bacterium GW2011_GWD2_52_7]|uniref:Integral membrane protein n=1 Tax=Candidatus Uhrbacteria bacterium GW2011_GWD2_52_7 TaxID=1618989 RepID=A0A0G1XGJ0_9BACT|nr:MAG: Integral membrane protein [Candidatus Uhrbacteria bacterium GW2011_GWD2_52_7]